MLLFLIAGDWHVTSGVDIMTDKKVTTGLLKATEGDASLFLGWEEAVLSKFSKERSLVLKSNYAMPTIDQVIVSELSN